MVRIAPVQLQYSAKPLWFDPKDLELAEGCKVIVSTERGTEYGICSSDIIEMDEDAIAQLKSPLKPVLRIATEEDLVKVGQLREKSAEALPVFKKLAAEENENMRPVAVEYLFDEEKAVFFFEAEERIDFRELVRKLANELKVRVDMRQIGVRDEARMVGGLGHCGQELCCKRLGGEFCPVSIRMAKEQDLSLNPQKISGVCGRLMCCLRYEFDAYKDFKGRAPKQGSKVQTPAGEAKVVELNVPKELVTVQLEEDAKRVTFPLSAMDAPAEGEKRPKRIGSVFEEYANPDPFALSASLGMFDTARFTSEDKLGTPQAHHNAPVEEEAPAEKQTGRKRRKRKRRSGSSGGSNTSASATSSTKEAARSSIRPGQKSSSLSGAASAAGKQTTRVPSTHRKSRRRSHKAGSGENES